MKRVFVLVLLGSLFPALVHAQGLGSIVGTISDPSGSVLSAATIKVRDAGTGFTRTAATNSEGYFVISALKPSQYDITVEMAGFRTYAQKQLTLLADQTLTVNASLVVGSTTEVVEVNSNQVQVDISTPTIKQVIEQQRITELPLNGRNAAQLTLLTAGTVNSPMEALTRGLPKPSPAQLQFQPMAHDKTWSVINSMAATTWMNTPMSINHFRFPMRYRNSACRRATIPPSMGKTPGR